MRSIRRAAFVSAALLALPVAAQAQGALPNRIAYVNTEALMAIAPGRAAVDTILQKEGDGYKAELAKMQDSLNNMLTRFQKNEVAMSAAKKDSAQKAMQTLNTEMQARQLQLQQKFQAHQSDLMAPILERVRKVLDDIRIEDGYSMIIANDPGNQVIVSADKNLDITDRVVARLRSVTAAEKEKAPAATKPGTQTPAGVTKPKPPAP
jgi:outer membrane protein